MHGYHGYFTQSKELDFPMFWRLVRRIERHLAPTKFNELLRYPQTLVETRRQDFPEDVAYTHMLSARFALRWRHNEYDEREDYYPDWLHATMVFDPHIGSAHLGKLEFRLAEQNAVVFIGESEIYHCKLTKMPQLRSWLEDWFKQWHEQLRQRDEAYARLLAAELSDPPKE